MMLFGLLLNAQQRLFYPKHTLYFDSENKNDPLEDGTARHPYDSWDDIGQMQEETRYYFRRGLSYNVGIMEITSDKVEISTYGVGDEATFISSARQNKAALNLNNRKNVVIKGIAIKAPTALACIQIKGDQTRHIQILDCNLSEAEFGIRIIAMADDLFFSGNTIHRTDLDGIYAMHVKKIEIAYSNIYDVNRAYDRDKDQKQSSGDCIQLISDNGLQFSVHHNLLDHSGYGNKFCFIAEGDNYSGSIVQNTFVCDNHVNTSAVYLHPTNDTIKIAYNWFEGGEYGIYSYASKMNVYYNIFKGQQKVLAIRDHASGSVFNNLFYKPVFFYESAKGTSLESFNNIFVVKGDAKLNEIKGRIISDYNLYTSKIKDFRNEDHSIYGKDAGLVNPVKNNFGLMENSPCMDAGKSHFIKKDISGKRVPSRQQTDLGPFELQ